MSAATPREIAERCARALGHDSELAYATCEAVIREAARPLVEAAQAVVEASNIRDVVYRGQQMAVSLPRLRAATAACREREQILRGSLSVKPPHCSGEIRPNDPVPESTRWATQLVVKWQAQRLGISAADYDIIADDLADEVGRKDALIASLKADLDIFKRNLAAAEARVAALVGCAHEDYDTVTALGDGTMRLCDDCGAVGRKECDAPDCGNGCWEWTVPTLAHALGIERKEEG